MITGCDRGLIASNRRDRRVRGEPSQRLVFFAESEPRFNSLRFFSALSAFPAVQKNRSLGTWLVAYIPASTLEIADAGAALDRLSTDTGIMVDR